MSVYKKGSGNSPKSRFFSPQGMVIDFEALEISLGVTPIDDASSEGEARVGMTSFGSIPPPTDSIFDVLGPDVLGLDDGATYRAIPPEDRPELSVFAHPERGISFSVVPAIHRAVMMARAGGFPQQASA